MKKLIFLIAAQLIVINAFADGIIVKIGDKYNPDIDLCYIEKYLFNIGTVEDEKYIINEIIYGSLNDTITEEDTQKIKRYFEKSYGIKFGPCNSTEGILSCTTVKNGVSYVYTYAELAISKYGVVFYIYGPGAEIPDEFKKELER